MRIGVIGATGKLGKCIFREAINREYDVTAIIRDQTKVATPNLQLLVKDAFDLTVDDIKQFDVIVSAVGFQSGNAKEHVRLGHHYINIFHEAPEVRLIIVGNAGSLYINDKREQRVVDNGKMPAIIKSSALAQTISLLDFVGRENINFSIATPALFFDAAGVKSGNYQFGNDVVLVNNKGYSYITYYDFASAIVDEIEQKKFERNQFTVVGELGKASFITKMMNKTMMKMIK